MIINTVDPDELRDAAEEWTILAEEASKQRKYKLAKACRDHAALYAGMAEGLEKLMKQRELLAKPRSFLRTVGGTDTEGESDGR